MTTIVADLNGMAADQRCTGGGPMAHVCKIHRHRQSLFGYAGDAMLATHLIGWLKGSRDIAELYKLIPDAHRDSVEVLELSKDGLALWSGWGARLPLMDTSYAIGSGSMSALLALRGGASPAQAITMACGLDECSGVLTDPHYEPLVKPRKRR